MLIHFPIGMLFLVAVLFVFKKWKQTNEYDAAIFLGLCCSFGAALFAAITGWFLSEEGGYDVDFLFWHKWLGIATTTGLFVLLWIYKNPKIPSFWSNTLFVVTLGTISVTGHFGGSLTHGSEYLFEYAPLQNADNFINKTPEELLVYADIIQPIIQQKCVACHKPSKMKGELDMTQLAGLMKGGKSGLIFNGEHPFESELLKRVGLPLEEKKHMPPKGKIQLTDDEKVLLEWWIENKTCGICMVGEMDNQEKVSAILQKKIKPTSTLDTLNLAKVTDKQLLALENNGIQITSLVEGNALVALRVLPQTKITASAIKAMKSIGENIVELNLTKVALDQKLIDFISGLDNLQKLQLQHTTVTDKAISKVKKLKNLNSLNLYNTSISDASIEDLISIIRLKNLYVWQSEITSEGVARLKKRKPQLNVYNGVDMGVFGKTTLNPPAIVAEAVLFEDYISVQLKNDLKNSVLHYTLDGDEPDSTSAIYTEPILLAKSSMVKAIARKEGWGGSGVNEKQFIKIEQKVLKATLSKKPSPKYGGNEKTLVDLQESTPDFRNGQWLGYEASHLTAVLELEKKDTLSAVFVSALSDPSSWIFYPKAIKVWLSEGGDAFEFASEIFITKDHRDGTELSYFAVPFLPKNARYVKIEIMSILKNPDWHPSPGGGSWFFVDEILVN